PPSVLTSDCGHTVRSSPSAEADPREWRYPPFRRQVQHFPEKIAEPRSAIHQVDDSGRVRGDLRPAVNQAKNVGGQRPTYRLVVVREELRSVGRDIDVRRAFGPASFAGKTEIEGTLHVVVLPAVSERLALKQLEQHMSTTARAVLLLERYHVARTHR